MKHPNFFTKRSALVLVMAAAAAALGLSRTADATDVNPQQTQAFDRGPVCDLRKELVFHDSMRKLWEDHITWTRLFIVSLAGSLADADLTAQRLLKNQVDIGDAFKPFYGQARGTQLTDLLTEHILIAAQILTAAKGGDSAAVDTGVANWRANATDIATFLHEVNPRQWQFAEMQDMMFMHLDLTLQEAVARLSGDFATDIARYEDVHLEILDMADTLSNGIIRQFPRRFN